MDHQSLLDFANFRTVLLELHMLRQRAQLLCNIEEGPRVPQHWVEVKPRNSQRHLGIRAQIGQRICANHVQALHRFCVRAETEDHGVRNRAQACCERLCLLGTWRLCLLGVRRLHPLDIWRLRLLGILPCWFRAGLRRLWPAGDEDSRGVYFHIFAVVPQGAKDRDTRALLKSVKGCRLSTLADGDGVVVVHKNALISVGDCHGTAVRRSGNLSRELAFTLGGIERSAVGLRVGCDGGCRKQGERQCRQQNWPEFSHDALLML